MNLLLEEDFSWKSKLDKTGGGYCVYVNKEMQEYLGITDPENDVLVFKCDVSKTHGRFIGFGVENNKKKKREG